jgi:hypothetical protein
VLQPAAQLLSASFARVRESGLLDSTAADLPLMPRAGPLRPGDEAQHPNSNPSPSPNPNPNLHRNPNPNPSPNPNQAQYDALGRLLGYCVVRHHTLTLTLTPTIAPEPQPSP